MVGLKNKPTLQNFIPFLQFRGVTNRVTWLIAPFRTPLSALAPTLALITPVLQFIHIGKPLE